jgi:peptide/nickel transport system ATP-binding protein
MPDRLRVESLRVTVQGSTADVVGDVSFAIAGGQVLGMVGESGSGKTTVALAVMGHARRGLEISGGSVRLGGDDVLGMAPRELQSARGSRMAYVAQDPASALNPALTVGRQLREIFRAHDEALDPDARLPEMLEEVRLDGIGDVLSAYPHQLSGGQQQRVMIAAAFACRPELIVLDEPTTGLDVTTQRHVLTTIEGLCDSYGVAALYVSHDLAVVGEIAHHVGVMYAGRLVELGSTAEIFSMPGHPYTRGLLRSIPRSDRTARLRGISGRPPRPGARPRGCSFAPRCPMVIDACSAQEPPPLPVGSASHVARCIRVQESVAESRRASGNGDDLQAESGRGSEALLHVTGVSAAYGDQPVLHDVGLSVAAGECLAIVGESGSGKTTLARCIVGLHENWTGEIALRGEPLASGVRQRELRAVRSMQYVFQNPYTSLNPRKTILQIVEQPLVSLASISAGARRDRVVTALDDVALGADYLRRYPDELSGGERQRVAIARAIVDDPAVLVCDEVTSALDVSVQATIVELLRRLRVERGLTLLFITHDLAVVRSIAQRAVVMNDGEIVETGTTARILDEPEADYTRMLLADVPTLRRTVGERPVPGVDTFRS